MEKYDIVIIGSGCGGSPAAGNLASAGAKVCVLERGTWWGPLQGKRTFPKDYLQVLRHIRGLGVSLPFFKKYIPINKKAGLLEFYLVDGYIHIIPCGVGGGSLVIGGYVDKPPKDIYGHYPDEITPEEMEPYFESVARVVQPAYAPKKTWYMEATDKACDNIPGIKSEPQLASNWYGSGPDTDEERVNEFGCKQKNYNYSPDDLTGINRGSKNSMDITYLQLVLKNGGEIRELSEVTGIRKAKDGYIVDYIDLNDNLRKSITAPKIIVSAGGLNTMKILFASKANKSDGLPLLSDKLGHRWGHNGDRVGMKIAWHSNLDHSYNPCIFRYHEIESDKYDYDFHQFACTSTFMAWAPPPLNFITNRIMPYLSLTREEPIGRIFPAGDVVDIYYPSQDCHRRADMYQRLITMEIDALNKPISDEKRKKKMDKIERIRAWKGIGTVHQQGGASMANTIAEGVCDHTGEVFNYPGLFVCDASILPIATCCGPHFFILAHSDRISKLMIEREK
ncbi:MAG: GMC oxidoreductase [Thermodesulfobacteriota bacterium]|nr:GMC oxidoreductase [Thermodesulfobacteriota bacterium]